MPDFSRPLGALGASAGGGGLGFLARLLEPLDYPRRALWGGVSKLADGDVLGAAPGLAGAGAGILGSLLAGPGAGLLAGSLVGGGGQYAGEQADPERFAAPTPQDAATALGLEEGTAGGTLGSLLLGMAGDPLTYTGMGLGRQAGRGYSSASIAANDTLRAAEPMHLRLAALRDLERRMVNAQGTLSELAYTPTADVLDIVGKRVAKGLPVGDGASVYTDDILNAIPDRSLFTQGGTARKASPFFETRAYQPGTAVDDVVSEQAAALGLGWRTPAGLQIPQQAVKSGLFESRGGRLFPGRSGSVSPLSTDIPEVSLSRLLQNPREAAFLKMLTNDLTTPGAQGLLQHPADMALTEGLPLVREAQAALARNVARAHQELSPLAKLFYSRRGQAPQLPPVDIDDPFWLSQAFNNINPFGAPK